MRATVENIGIHAGKKFNTQNEECMNVSISIILPAYLPIHHVQYNMLTVTEKTDQGKNSPPKIWCRCC